MSAVLDKAIAELIKLPEDAQDAVARWLLEELTSERGWAERFGNSQEALSRLAEEARNAIAHGKATDLDPAKL